MTHNMSRKWIAVRGRIGAHRTRDRLIRSGSSLGPSHKHPPLVHLAASIRYPNALTRQLSSGPPVTETVRVWPFAIAMPDEKSSSCDAAPCQMLPSGTLPKNDTPSSATLPVVQPLGPE